MDVSTFTKNLMFAHDQDTSDPKDDQGDKNPNPEAIPAS